MGIGSVMATTITNIITTSTTVIIVIIIIIIIIINLLLLTSGGTPWVLGKWPVARWNSMRSSGMPTLSAYRT
jgi:hypothetical protein